MRYILDSSGYVESVSCTPFNCKDKSCKEYTGTIPSGYETLSEWATNANIRAYKITSGNLVYDAAKDAELEAKWALTGDYRVYSEEEKIIGQWIDGKPIYRKVVNFGALTSGASGRKVAHGISNLGIFINIYGIATTGSGGLCYPLPLQYKGSESNYNVELSVDVTHVGTVTNTDRSFLSAYVILEYTKTTD